MLLRYHETWVIISVAWHPVYRCGVFHNACVKCSGNGRLSQICLVHKDFWNSGLFNSWDVGVAHLLSQTEFPSQLWGSLRVYSGWALETSNWLRHGTARTSSSKGSVPEHVSLMRALFLHQSVSGDAFVVKFFGSRLHCKLAYFPLGSTVKFRSIIPGCIVLQHPSFKFCDPWRTIFYIGSRVYRFPVSIALFQGPWRKRWIEV